MNKVTKALWLLFVVAFIATVYMCGWNLYLDLPSEWMLYTYHGLKRNETALFLIGGSLARSETYVFVRDPAVTAGKPIQVGMMYASDGPVKFREARWSQDGSVIAIRAEVGQQAGKGFSRVDGTYWTSAYDFASHRAVTGEHDVHTTSQTIMSLLADRGGAAEPLKAVSINNAAKTLRWSEFNALDLTPTTSVL